MKISINCKGCGELIFFDIDTLGCSSPLEIGDVEEIFREEFGVDDIKPEQMEKIMKMYCEDKEYKGVRFYQKCPKCGSQTTLHMFVPLS